MRVSWLAHRSASGAQRTGWHTCPGSRGCPSRRIMIAYPR
jgi:hypothetical protein